MVKRAKAEQAKKQAQKRQLDEALAGDTHFEYLDAVEGLEPEDIPRRFKEDDDEEGLPVIVDGKVKHVKRRKTQSNEGDVGSDSETESGSEAERQAAATAADVEAATKQHEAFQELCEIELKERVALFAESIMAEPEENLPKLRELLEIAERTRKTRTRQLVMLAVLQIFKSVIPGYRIKELSGTQLQEKVSKEVKQLRDYEQGLLGVYKRYVHLVHHSFKQGKTPDGVKHSKYVLANTALEVACDLVESLSHFNFRQELLHTIIEKLSSQRVDTAFQRCLQCVRHLFEIDNEGHLSFEAVQALAKMIKARRYKVDSRVVSVLVHLRLLTELTGRADLERMIKDKPASFAAQHHLKKKDRVHLTKSQRKARKEQLEINEEMRKAELGVSAKVRERLQSQTLKMVFVLYMNILKLRARNLMGATLEGLAKYAHLINAELYGDLLEVLREILEKSTDAANTRQYLLCILTAFQLLRGQGGSQEQSTDLGFFVEQLYHTLGHMCLSPAVERSHRSLQSSHAGKFASETDMLVRCLELLFIKRRGVSRPRLLAFTKRLAECSLQFPERSSLIALKVMRAMCREHPEAAALLSTEDRVGRGRYIFDAELPEQANAEVATVWEVALLRQHYDPRVQSAAREVKGSVV